MSRERRHILVLSLAVSSLVGCTGPDLAETLRECALISDGELRQLPFYAPTECYEACLAEASCDELRGALCRTSITLGQRCDARCAHRCADGALIAVEEVCNGVAECADESDERGCATHTCADGTTLTGEHRCDGIARCPDRSDEDDCPLNCDGLYPPPSCPPIECADGAMIPAGGRCNGWPQCPDGSDEESCAELIATCE